MKAKFALLSIICLICFSSCEQMFKEVAEPVYFKIDSFTVNTDYSEEGSDIHDISDAWVYVDDQLQGVYELPAKFPVIATEGSHDVLITPGIKLNGIAATRFDYKVMTSYQTTASLSIGDTITFDPEVEYRDNATFKWLEDFEQGGESWIKDDASDTTLTTQSVDSLVFEGDAYGEIFLADDMTFFEIQSNNDFFLPNSGTPVFLELNHRSISTSDSDANRLLAIGLVAYKSSAIVQTEPFIYLNSKDEWNKTYVNLTATIADHQDAFLFKIYFGIAKEAGSGEVHTILDNIKLVHL